MNWELLGTLIGGYMALAIYSYLYKENPVYRFVELAVPDAFVGQSLEELRLRRSYGVWIVGIKDPLTGKLHFLPDAQVKLDRDQILLAVGTQTDIQRLAGILLGHPAGAFQSDNMLRILEYDIPGLAVRDDSLQVFEADILLDCDQLFGSLEWHYLAMI